MKITTTNHRDDLCWTATVHYPDGRTWETHPVLTHWGAWLRARWHVTRQR